MDLAVTYDTLRSEVGYFLGYGRSSAGWDDDQEENIKAAVDAGYRQFITPPAAPGKRGSYQWTFLTPTIDVSLVADVRDYALPVGFRWFEGDLHVVTTTDVYAECKRRGIGELLQLRAEAGGSVAGRPTYAAVKPRTMDGGTGAQRYDLMVYPTPDTTYTLRGRAQMNPPALSPANPYPYGGDVHAETIKQACLAAAERDIDDAPQGGHMAAFMQCLQASIDADVKLRPSNLGYAGDGVREPANRVTNSVTWNGVLYEG